MINNNKDQARGVYVPVALLGAFPAIQAVVLAQIMYWHRLTEGGERRFAGDKCQLSYSGLAQQLSLSKNQVRLAVKKLAEVGVIVCEFKTITLQDGRKMNNVLYISIHDEKLCEIYPEWADIEHVVSATDDLPAEHESTFTEVPGDFNDGVNLNDWIRQQTHRD